MAERSHVVICRSRITPSARELFVRTEDYRRDIHWSLLHIAGIYLMFNHRHFLPHPFQFIIHTSFCNSTFLALSIYIKHKRPSDGRHCGYRRAVSALSWGDTELLASLLNEPQIDYSVPQEEWDFFEPHCYCSSNCHDPTK